MPNGTQSIWRLVLSWFLYAKRILYTQPCALDYCHGGYLPIHFRQLSSRDDGNRLSTDRKAFPCPSLFTGSIHGWLAATYGTVTMLHSWIRKQEKKNSRTYAEHSRMPRMWCEAWWIFYGSPWWADKKCKKNNKICYIWYWCRSACEALGKTEKKIA